MSDLAEYRHQAQALPTVKLGLPATPDALREELASGRRQGAFRWDPEAWERWLPFDGVPELTVELGGLIDRAGVTAAVNRHYEERPDLAFIAVMVWGYGDAGYGPFRTYRKLTGSTEPLQPVREGALESLRTSAAVLLEDGPEAAYYVLNNRPTKIPYLGSAFFTKWLSFIAETNVNRAGTVPILDALVRRWIAREAGVTLRLDNTSHYEAYLRLLDHWAAGEYSRVRVEEAIFRLARPDLQGVGTDTV